MIRAAVGTRRGVVPLERYPLRTAYRGDDVVLLRDGIHRHHTPAGSWLLVIQTAGGGFPERLQFGHLRDGRRRYSIRSDGP